MSVGVHCFRRMKLLSWFDRFSKTYNYLAINSQDIDSERQLMELKFQLNIKL